MKIFVVEHKNLIKALPCPYYLIGVGNHPSLGSVNILRDKEGENISEKNPAYCELTALYWIWKNVTDQNVVGLCHYRRFFDFHSSHILNYKVIVRKSQELETFNLDVPENVLTAVEKGAVVVGRKHFYHESVYENLCRRRFAKPLQILEDIVKESGEEYYQSYKKLMYHSNGMYPYNMTLIRKDYFDEYCEWLFEVFFKWEKMVGGTSSYGRYPRMYGYLGERMFNIWLDVKKHKLIVRPVIVFDDSYVKGKSTMIFKMKLIAKRIVFMFGK